MSINKQFKYGFTIVEIMIVAPIVILVIGAFITGVVKMTGDVLATRSSDALAYTIQDALNSIEQDVKSSGAFLATNNVTLTTPQGYNDDRTNFHNADATTGTMLILNTYATTSSTLGSNLNTVYLSGQPNSCSSNLVKNNSAVMINIVYFVKNGTLWRRTLMPASYDTIGCNVPWQQPSCSLTASGAFCKAKDIRLVDNVDSVNGFTTTYYPDQTSTTANTVAVDSAQSDSVRLAALKTTKSVKVTINATTTQSGRSISRTNTIRASSANNNVSATAAQTIPVMTSQPKNVTALASDINVTFQAEASGTNPTAQWQQSTNAGATWTDISGATSSTLTLSTVANTMDGYRYRVIFTNSLGSVTSSAALLTVNLLSWTNLTLQNSWTNYGTEWNSAAYRKTSDGVVIVKGLIKRTGTPVQYEVLGTLPESYRPSSKLIFIAGTNPDTSARIDVYPDGSIVYIYGDPGWLSMDNIHFVPDTGRYTRTAIGSFLNGWANYGDTFATASYVVDNNNRVNVQGLVKPGTVTNGTAIFNLPNNLLPSQYLHIATSSNSIFGFMGVHYVNTGSGILAKGLGSSYLSIIGTYYPSLHNGWSNLSLVNSWVSFGDIYSTPQYTIAPDGLVSLKGLVKSGGSARDTIIANLPVGYRPAQRVLYITVSADVYGRIDIDNGGNIRFVVGNNGWISLDGITFYADQ